MENIEIEAKVQMLGQSRGKASVHITLPDNIGSLTISNISVWEDGKAHITLPLTQVGGNKRLGITLQGELKQMVIEAIAKEYNKGKKSYMVSK